MGLIEVHRAFHHEVVISCPMEHEYIPLAQLIPIPFCGTNYGAYFGDTLPRVFTMIQKGRFDEAWLAELRTMGHEIREREKIGRVHAIGIEKDGALRPVADPRGGGAALVVRAAVGAGSAAGATR